MARSTSPLVQQLRARCIQAAHLLGPIDPEHGQAVTLLSRLQGDDILSTIVSRYSAGASFDQLVPAWPLPDHDPALRRALTGHTDWVRAVAVAPDGSWLASAADDWTVRLWNIDGSPRATWPCPAARGWVRAVAVAPDGSWLASAAGRTVRLFNTADGTLRAILSGHSSWVNAVAVGTDGRWLVSASADHTVRLWNAADGKLRAIYPNRLPRFFQRFRSFGAVRAVAVAPDGNWIASAGNDHTVRLWNTNDGSPRATLTGHTDWVNSVAVAPDGNWIASVSADHTVRLWNTADGSCTTVVRVDGPLTDCTIFPDGRHLFVSGHAGLYLFAYRPRPRGA